MDELTRLIAPWLLWALVLGHSDFACASSTNALRGSTLTGTQASSQPHALPSHSLVRSASGLDVRATTADSTSASPPDPIWNMCWRAFAQSTIKNGFLYIDGGLESYSGSHDGSWYPDDNSTATAGYNVYLIKIDLSTSWDWKVNISEVALNKTADPSTGSLAELVINGALYAGPMDGTKIFLYGGTTNYWNVTFPGFLWASSDMYVLWSYDTISAVWEQHNIQADSPNRPHSGISIEAPELGLAFYVNGELDWGSQPTTKIFGNATKVFLEGMIVIDTATQTAKNVSTSGYSNDHPRSRGDGVYVPGIGQSGVLVLVGGTYKSADNMDSQEMANFVPLDVVDVFDVSAFLRGGSDELWYKQNATGDVPEPRAYFCTVLVSAVDNSSHNIYLYGGIGEQGIIYDDVHVLSLPSFVWKKVNFGSSPRFGHTCHRVGDQMITVGGIGNAGWQLPCDWEARGVGIMNMSSITWGSVFQPEHLTSPYVVPAVVEAVIEDPNTTTPLTRPKAGWSDDKLGQVFGDAQAFSSGPSSLTRGGKIGLGVTISVVVLVLICLALTWYIWGRQTDKPDRPGRHWNPFQSTDRRIA